VHLSSGELRRLNYPPPIDISLKKWNKHTGAGRRGNSGKKAKEKEPMAEALPSEGQSLMSRRVISSS
jgi:hypothetical protein